MSDKKGRNWCTVVYQESAPVGWIKTLELMNIECFISPLHNEDVNTDTGEIKKPHWHVTARYSGPVEEKRVRRDFSFIGGVGCEPVRDWVAYARYLCHLDSPDKWKYSPDDVICLGGADYYATITKDKKSLFRTQKEMEDFIEEHKMFSYYLFSRYCAENNWEWYVVLQKRGNAIMTFMKSIMWTIGEKRTRAAVYQNIYCPDWIQMSEEGFEPSDGNEKVSV